MIILGDEMENKSLLEIIQVFVRAEMWATSQIILEQHPELLTEDADYLIGQLIETQENEADRWLIEEHRKLLQQCRQKGIANAFRERIAGGIPTAPPQFWGLMQQAEVAEQRYLQMGDVNSLDEAISLWEEILNHSDFSEAALDFQLAALNNAGSPYLHRFWACGDVSDLNRALMLWRESVALTPSDSSELSARLNNLGTALLDSYAQTGSLEDLEEAISMYRKAMSFLIPDAPDLSDYLNNMGSGLRQRYIHTGNLENLHEAVHLHREAIEGVSSDSPDLPMFLNNLGIALEELYRCSGEVTNLEEAIRAYHEAIQRTHPDAPDLPSFMSNLGNGMRERYGRTGNRADLEDAIRVLQEAVQKLPLQSPDLPMCLNNLGSALSDHYSCTGDLTDLQGAIQFHREAVELTPTEAPSLPSRLNNLGNVLLAYYDITGAPEVLDEAVQTLREAVRLTPNDSPALPSRLNNLGSGLNHRYSHKGNQNDLEEAIRIIQEAISLLSPGSPDLPAILNNLGSALRDRYIHSGSPVNLVEALRVGESAIERTPTDSPVLPSRLNNLGNILRSLYIHTGNLEYLERAIANYEETIHRTPPNNPDLATYFNNLGNGYSDRYHRNGNIADLERVIQAYREAIRLTPANSPALAFQLNNLGNALRDRYTHTGQLDYLDEAIYSFQESVKLTPETSPNLPISLNNLGIGLSTRYNLTGDLGELENAIHHYRRAMRLDIPNSPSYSMLLNNLGNALIEHYNYSGDFKEIEEAISLYKRAVHCTPLNSPSQPMHLNNLGIGLHDLYIQTRNMKHLNEAVSIFQQAWEILDDAFYMSPVSFKLGQQARYFGLYISSVWAALQLAQDSESEETRTLAARDALLFAEGSKSRILGEILGRGDITTPPIIPTGLQIEEQALLTRLEALDCRALSSGSMRIRSERLPTEDTFVRRNDLMKELHGIWNQMETFGAEAASYVFLRKGSRLGWHNLQSLVDNMGPEIAFISLFIGDKASVFFILRSGWEAPQFREVPLSSQVWADIISRLKREVWEYKGSTRRKETWHKFLTPILEQILNDVDGVKQLIITPHKQGHLIPWAAVPVNSKPLGLDYSLVTTPTLSVLNILLTRPAASSKGILVVGNPTGDLPGSELEAKTVAKLLKTIPYIGEKAALTVVERAFSNSCLAHLATHASFIPEDPFSSGFMLADEVYTARRAMQSKVNLELLVISGCQSGLSETLGGDELAGLSQAFLIAGVHSLLVSLWPVDDPSTAYLMNAFYKNYLKNERDAAKAICQAMVITRERWPHTYYWAGFTLVGN